MNPWTGKRICGTSELDLIFGLPEKINVLPPGTEFLKVTDIHLLRDPIYDEASGKLWTHYVVVWFRTPREAKVEAVQV